MVNPANRLFEVYMDFSGGRNSEISNEELKDSEFPTLDNVDLWSRGSCKRRTGRKSIFSLGATNVPGVAEIDTLTITSGPTKTGFVNIVLNGKLTNVAVNAGVAEVDTLTVTKVSTRVGYVTITLGSTSILVPLTPLSTTAQVATAISEFVNTYYGSQWTASVKNSTVTFTWSATGANTSPTFNGGLTGATATFKVTTSGVTTDAATDVANKIRTASFDGWTTGGTGTTVTFTKTQTGKVSAPSYSATDTGANGTFTVTQAGSNGNMAQGIFPFFRPNMTQPDLIIANAGQLYVMQAGQTTYTAINITDNGSPFTFQASLPVQGVMYKGIMYVATGTKLVQVTWDATNGWKSQTVAPYQPTVMEAEYIGTNALATNPNNFIQDGTGTTLTVAGIAPTIATGTYIGNLALSGAVNLPYKFTCYINKPSSVTSVDYKWEYQLSTDGANWTLGRDWTKDDGSGNAKNWTFSPSSIATYNFRVSVRDDANQTTTVNTYVMSSWVVDSTPNNQQLKPPPTSGIQNCTNVIVFYDRLILFGDNQNPYQVYISDLTNPLYFPTDNTISFDTGKLEPITAIVQFRDFLIVFTASTIQTLTGHTPSDYSKALIQDGIGCIAPRSAIVTGNTVTFLSAQGIFQLKPNPFLIQVLNVNRVDMQIRTEILNAIQNNGQNACAFLYNSQYWICFPTTTQMFRLYFETGMVWTRDYSPNILATQFVVYGANRWELGSNGTVYVQDDNRYDDDGYAYTMVAESKDFDLGSSFNWKKLKRIFLLAKHMGTDTKISLTIKADSSLVLTPETDTVSVVNQSPSYYGDVTWVSTTTPNIQFYEGTVIGSWILGSATLGTADISVQKASIRGKCHRVKVTIQHSDPVACELFGYGIEFREKRPT